jgi:hypothetical protein
VFDLEVLGMLVALEICCRCRVRQQKRGDDDRRDHAREARSPATDVGLHVFDSTGFLAAHSPRYQIPDSRYQI